MNDKSLTADEVSSWSRLIRSIGQGSILVVVMVVVYEWSSIEHSRWESQGVWWW